jgi:hypothetical protein
MNNKLRELLEKEKKKISNIDFRKKLPKNISQHGLQIEKGLNGEIAIKKRLNEDPNPPNPKRMKLTTSNNHPISAFPFESKNRLKSTKRKTEIPTGPSKIMFKTLFDDIIYDPRLSPEQRRVLEEILDGKNVFVTGKAGTGKSFLISKMIRLFTRVFEREEDGEGDPAKKFAVTAPTGSSNFFSSHFITSSGIAAANIGGCTIHSWAGIGIPPPRIFAGHPSNNHNSNNNYSKFPNNSQMKDEKDWVSFLMQKARSKQENWVITKVLIIDGV